MTRASRQIIQRALTQLGGATGTQPQNARLAVRAQNLTLGTRFRAAEAASAALLAGASEADQIARLRGRAPGRISLSTRHVEASLLSFMFLQFANAAEAPAARIAPEERTAAAGFYPTADDRWIYLHSGFPHNTAGLLKLLGARDDREAVAAAVRTAKGLELENLIAEAGLCGAMVRSPWEWDESAAGQLLASSPIVEIIQTGDSPPEPLPADADRPLAGSRVLDLTRILAGPTCARTLASYGAGVLRVGARHLPSIPLFVADTGFGKRSTHLNLMSKRGKTRLRGLIRQSDVFSQGYRSGAMDRLGFGVSEVTRLRPGIVYVSINCYGHEGPWRARPGWEQLAQTVTGMAAVQGEDFHGGLPQLLPAAVTDYTTGYLAALGALSALRRRSIQGGSYWVRVSLARTGVWIRGLGTRSTLDASPLSQEELARLRSRTQSPWGAIDYLRPAVELSSSAVRWELPPVPLGTHPPEFD